ncbi:MAG: S-adenosylmethionine:tRNA ribosyltransferase-isomerase [Bacteroidales bacterium]
MRLKEISVEDYNYQLPEHKIAKYPLERRENAKLLIYNAGEIQQDIFKNIPDYLSDNQLMIFNDAKVISARLQFQKETGANIEVFCLEPYQPADYNLAFQQKETVAWKGMVGNLKKWKTGPLKKKLTVKGKFIDLAVERLKKEGGYVILQFKWNSKEVNFSDILEHAGKVPIPPYLKRETEKIDQTRYQTKYSRTKGSVAAPTAGLHFDEFTLNKIKEKNIPTEKITLHVGAGTFRPVQTDDIRKHEMHTEHFSVSLQTIDNLINHKGKILAVGTTTVRTLESLYWLGVKLKSKGIEAETENFLHQWEHTKLDNTVTIEEALNELINYTKKNNNKTFNGSTQIMITPGYQFKMTHSMITNFHQPKSTLLMLIAAFIGDDWEKVYDYALKNNFRFLSYGDSSLLFPKEQNFS